MKKQILIIVSLFVFSINSYAGNCTLEKLHGVWTSVRQKHIDDTSGQCGVATHELSERIEIAEDGGQLTSFGGSLAETIIKSTQGCDFKTVLTYLRMELINGDLVLEIQTNNGSIFGEMNFCQVDGDRLTLKNENGFDDRTFKRITPQKTT